MQQLVSCPACTSRNIALAYWSPTTRGQDNKKWRVDECSDCTHQFLNPQPSWEEVEPYYSDYAAFDPKRDDPSLDGPELEAARHSGRLRHITLRPGKLLLDVGCNTGKFIRLAKKLGMEVTGIEPREQPADLGRSNGLNIFGGTLEDFANSTSEKFDMITANQVIEHVPNPIEVLATMRSLLAPGGIVWISVPNAAYPLARSLKGRWHSTDIPLHLMQFTPRSLAIAGERAGLVAVTQETESLNGAVAGSIRQYLRHTWKLPQRVTTKIGSINSIAAHYARWMDAKANGEAILAEFTS